MKNWPFFLLVALVTLFISGLTDNSEDFLNSQPETKRPNAISYHSPKNTAYLNVDTSLVFEIIQNDTLFIYRDYTSFETDEPMRDCIIYGCTEIGLRRLKREIAKKTVDTVGGVKKISFEF